MSTRSKRFESWFAKRTDLDLKDVRQMWNGETYRSYRYHVELAWAAWKEALLGG